MLHRLAGAGGRQPPLLVLQAYADSIALIEGTAEWMSVDTGEIEALGWTNSASTGLATPPALRTDPAIMTRSSYVLGFLILPTVFATPVAQFNPSGGLPSRSRPSTPADIIAQVLRGAWGASGSAAGRCTNITRCWKSATQRNKSLRLSDRSTDSFH